MIDEKINLKYLEKIKLFQKYNKHYYDLNKPLVDDSKFDKLKSEIINLEKKYNFLNHKDSPSNSVGFKPSKIFKKVKKNIKYYAGKELVEVRVYTNPKGPQHKTDWAKFVVSVLVSVFVLDDKGNMIDDSDARGLAVNFYLHELEKHPFTLKDIQLVIKSVYLDHVQGDVLAGISFTDFVQRLRKHLKKLKDKKK